MGGFETSTVFRGGGRCGTTREGGGCRGTFMGSRVVVGTVAKAALLNVLLKRNDCVTRLMTLFFAVVDAVLTKLRGAYRFSGRSRAGVGITSVCLGVTGGVGLFLTRVESGVISSARVMSRSYGCRRRLDGVGRLTTRSPAGGNSCRGTEGNVRGKRRGCARLSVVMKRWVVGVGKIVIVLCIGPQAPVVRSLCLGRGAAVGRGDVQGIVSSETGRLGGSRTLSSIVISSLGDLTGGCVRRRGLGVALRRRGEGVTVGGGAGCHSTSVARLGRRLGLILRRLSSLQGSCSLLRRLCGGRGVLGGGRFGSGGRK